MKHQELPDSEIKNVADTAYWIAHLRAVESKRPDALFHDPLAEKLAGERGKNITSNMPASKITAWVVTLRTRIIDNLITKAIDEGVDTILNLGAGLDTRPYRMNQLPKSVNWIEVDFPEIIAYKNNTLKNDVPHVQLTRVALDLSSQSERMAFFASVSEKSKKVFILTEGVIPYLTNEQTASLAQDLRKFPNFNYWLLDNISPEARKHSNRNQMNEKMANAPFMFDPADWFAFFANEGWKEKESKYFWDEAQIVKRPMPLPKLIKVIIFFRSLFASEEQKQKWRKLSGYTLLEQK